MGRNSRPFRDHLTRWFLALVALVAAPILVIEVQRPWERLEQIVETSNAVLASVASDVSTDDLVRMNRVTLAMLPHVPLKDKRSAAAALWFLLEGEEIPDEAALKATASGSAG